MNENLPSTRSTDHDKPSIPAAYRIYGEERPDFEEGVVTAASVVLAALLTVGAILLAARWLA